jgi:hypothetical protein
MEGILTREWLSLFDKMDDPLRGGRFPSDDSRVTESVRTNPKDWFAAFVRKLAENGSSALI